VAEWRQVVAVGGFGLLAVGGASLVARGSGAPSYASFPGTIPRGSGDARCDVDAAARWLPARRDTWGGLRAVVRRPPPGGIVQALAVVSSPYARPSDASPAWVIVGRGVCDASSKGDVVSVGRSDPEAGRLPCTDDNLLMAVVDARTGRLVGVYHAYDVTGVWKPAA
jgi:hypothetical protein